MTNYKRIKTLEEWLQRNNVNQYIYRFRKNDNWMEDIIRNNRLYFTNPEGLKDPRDTRLKVNPKSVTENHLRAVFEKSYIKFNSYVINNVIAHYSLNQNEWAELANKSLKNNFKWGFCCFTAHWNNEVLWDYYTDHKGVAFKFDMLVDKKFFALPLKMKYSNSYPEVNFLNNSHALLKNICTKNEKYKHEDEIRIVKLKKGKYYFNKKALVQIIFGSKMENKEIEKIKYLCLNNNYSHIDFKKMKFPDFNYDGELISV